MTTDRPIAFNDLSLLTNGGAIVEGTLRIVTGGPLAPALEAPPGAVLVASFAGPRTTRSLDLIPPSPVQPDGWRDWRPPILSVWFYGLFPDLALRRYGSKAERFAVTIPDTTMIQVIQRYPADGSNKNPQIFGTVSSIEGTASRCPAGLHLRMTGQINPTEPNDHVPALTDARLECEALIPWTYLSAVGSNLASLIFDPIAEEQGPWQPDKSGAGALAISGPSAYFAGHLKLPGQHIDLYPDGPFLHAWISDSVMTLQGARDLMRMANGFVCPSRLSYGPEFTLQLGYDDFGRILGQSREAVLELRGGGIGHVYGQTGRDFGGRQSITACQVTLSKRADGLEIGLTGELGPFEDGGCTTPLGPAFEATVFVPTGYLMLRQWPIDRLVVDWRERMGVQFG